MATFDNVTAKEFWNLGQPQRLQLLQTIYKGTMDYLAEDDYDSLPYGVKLRINALLSTLEAKRVKK